MKIVSFFLREGYFRDRNSGLLFDTLLDREELHHFDHIHADIGRISSIFALSLNANHVSSQWVGLHRVVKHDVAVLEIRLVIHRHL